jgi:hypothetical protein
MTDSPIDFVTRAPAAGSLHVRWIHGAPARRRSGDPPIQVHHYDEHTVILLTGDTVLPGCLYAFDFPQFLASLDRMAALADTRDVTHVLGCHIEMTRQPGRDYPLGATYQPGEQALEMTVAQLTDVRAAAMSVAGRQGVHRFDDFVIYNQPGLRDQLKLITHGLLHKARGYKVGRTRMRLCGGELR